MYSLHIVGDDFDNVNSESSWGRWMEVVQEVHIDLKKGFHLKEFGRKLGCCSQHLHLLPMRNVFRNSHMKIPNLQQQKHGIYD